MEQEQYKFWKYPWGKWIYLAVAALQLLLLCLNASEYQSLAAAREGIIDYGSISSEAVDEELAGYVFQCASNVFMAGLFFGEFVIGCVSRTKEAALKGSMALMLVLTIGWIAAGLLLKLCAGSRGVLWGILLAIMVVGLAVAGWSLWKMQKGQNQE